MLFTIVQCVFSIIAKSQSMLADSIAMGIDAFTYLFNMVAERLKNQPLSTDESISIEERKRQRLIQKLNLELIPPLISVIVLIGVSIDALREAIATLTKSSISKSAEPNVSIMMLFSTLNLLLDLLNMSCFAKAKSFGFSIIESLGIGGDVIHDGNTGEATALLKTDAKKKCGGGSTDIESLEQENHDDTSGDAIDEYVNKICSADSDDDTVDIILNLNMCSAYTVSYLIFIFHFWS